MSKYKQDIGKDWWESGLEETKKKMMRIFLPLGETFNLEMYLMFDDNEKLQWVFGWISGNLESLKSRVRSNSF
jgi:hypothetical protein